VADYLRNAQIAGLPEAVRAGVALHRSIDAFTDRHPVVRKCAQRLHPFHGKYAPVVIDVFFDFFLMHNWECYSEEPFDAFVQNVYDILQESRDILPEGLRGRLPRMVSGGWLHSYGHPQGLEYAFLRLQSRMSKPEQLIGVMDTHRRFFDLTNQDFNDFFPEAIAFASDWQLT
jgi:acyl carrier protein phosphodiesterase